MSLYALWLVIGIVTVMVILLAIDRSLSKKKIVINNLNLPAHKTASVVSMNEKRLADKRSLNFRKTA